MDSEGRRDYRDDFEDDPPIKNPVFTIAFDPEAGRALRMPNPCDAADSSAKDVQVNSFFNFTERFRRFPDLPDFGILYLSVPEAAELVTKDLRLSKPHIFSSKDDGLLPPSRVQSSEAAGLARFTKDIQTRLLRSVESKNLHCRIRPKDFADFLNRGDEAFLPERTFIHFNDLVVWLREAGYFDHSDPAQLGPALQKFEQQELALAESVHADMEVRRSLRKRRVPAGWEGMLPAVSEADQRLRLQDQLAQAIEEIDRLQSQLATAKKNMREEGDKKSARTDSRIMAALAARCKIDLASPAATSQVKAALEQVGLSLSADAIRSRVKQALNAISEGSEN